MSILAKALSFLTILFYGGNSLASEEQLAPRPVIVELFTSQGCSSCPPADQVLKFLKENNPNVIPLSLHVDYWNYIGWRDPFSNKDITYRQKRYATAMNRRGVYTPQMVIDGKYQVVGSHYDKVESNIKKALRTTRDVPMSLKAVENKLEIEILPHVMQSGDSADVVVIGYNSHEMTEVTRGENSGEILNNSNIVQYLRKVGEYNGEKTTVISDLPDAENVLVILQKTGHKDIIGVSLL